MDNLFSLQNKNILITGASSGIGKAAAIFCNKAGANIILLGRNKERLREVYEQLSGNNNLMHSVELTEYAKLEEVVKDCVNNIGKIDGFVHSAGIEMTLPLKILKPEHFHQVFSINVIAGFELTKILSKKKYINTEGASFVYIASVMSELGEAGKTGYCASKGALLAGTRSIALELAQKNIRVNCISPGLVETNMSKKLLESLSELERENIRKMHPLGFGKPEDVAGACAFLISNEAKWITGTNLIIDGGYSAK